MKKQAEQIWEIPSEYVKDDCVQIMLNYKNYLLFAGENDILYYKNLKLKYPIIKPYPINKYIKDERKVNFPYSDIPEHIEKRNFKKIISANQILNYEEPYIEVNDRGLFKLIAYKENDKAIIYSKQLLFKEFFIVRDIVITKKELENYLKTGFIKNDNKKYKDYETIIFNLNGTIYRPELYGPELDDADDDFTISPKLMIKLKEKEQMKIDLFKVIRNKEDHILKTSFYDVSKEDLELLKSRIELRHKGAEKVNVKRLKL